MANELQFSERCNPQAGSNFLQLYTTKDKPVIPSSTCLYYKGIGNTSTVDLEVGDTRVCNTEDGLVESRYIGAGLGPNGDGWEPTNGAG